MLDSTCLSSQPKERLMKLNFLAKKVSLAVLISLVAGSAMAKEGRMYFLNNSFDDVNIQLNDYNNENHTLKTGGASASGANLTNITPGATSQVTIQSVHELAFDKDGGGGYCWNEGLTKPTAADSHYSQKLKVHNDGVVIFHSNKGSSVINFYCVKH